ncbi:MAG TPA: hypothetical protein VFD70_28930 [Anaerolineae bacterium]|nr:hypothetical protein [Anaerolineae bacterium]
MSSFNNPHHIYLFEMKNGKQKLAYGSTPEDAYESLRLRLEEPEIALVIQDKYIKIPQRDLQKYIHNLG